MWIAAPPLAERENSGSWMMQALGSIEQLPAYLKLHAGAGAVGKMLRRWKGSQDGPRSQAMHVIQYPHPDHGPGCDPTPPPTPPPPPTPAQCHPSICAGSSNAYAVSADVDVSYASTFSVPPIPGTFEPDAMTLYLYFNLVNDHYEDHIGR
jgi:hypothetical protein